MGQSADYYALLEVPRTATREEIRVAYLRLMKAAHPDVCRDSRAQLLAASLNRAYETLGNAGKRAAYDRSIGAVRRASLSNALLVVTSVVLIAGSGIAVWLVLDRLAVAPSGPAEAIAFTVQQLPATAANAATRSSSRLSRTELSLGIVGGDKPVRTLLPIDQMPTTAAVHAPELVREHPPALLAAVTAVDVTSVEDWTAPPQDALSSRPQNEDRPQQTSRPPSGVPMAAASPPRPRPPPREEPEPRKTSSPPAVQRSAEADAPRPQPRVRTRWPSADEPFFSPHD